MKVSCSAVSAHTRRCSRTRPATPPASRPPSIQTCASSFPFQTFGFPRLCQPRIRDRPGTTCGARLRPSRRRTVREPTGAPRPACLGIPDAALRRLNGRWRGSLLLGGVLDLFSAALYILPAPATVLQPAESAAIESSMTRKTLFFMEFSFPGLKPSPAYRKARVLSIGHPPAKAGSPPRPKRPRPTLACPCRAFHGNALGCTNDQDIRIDGRRYGPESWGWEQPGCRPAALALFIDDLHRILQEHAAGKLASCSTLADAQSQVDAARALQRHRPRAGSVPGAVRRTERRRGPQRRVPHRAYFSPRLKQSLVSMLGGKPS